MTFFTVKQVITSVIVASFLSLALFSFVIMTHNSEGLMTVGGCPLSVIGASLCPQESMASAAHHISAYRSFLNVPVGYGLTVLFAYLIILALAAIIFSTLRLPPLNPPIFAGGFQDIDSRPRYDRKITRWLSLLENSPSSL